MLIIKYKIMFKSLLLVSFLVSFAFPAFAQVRRVNPAPDYRRDNSSGISRPRVCRREISRGRSSDGKKDCSGGTDLPANHPQGNRICVNYSESLGRCLRYRRR